MRLIVPLIILLLLVPIASASVTREFTWNGEKHTESFSIPYDFADRNITITLTPSPFSDYDIPGYYITESLPSDITFYGTNAEWSDLSDRTLSILKFMPASDKSTITYTVRLDKEKKYDFFGTYKDENKVAGDIQTQTITVESKPLINFSNIWEPDEKEPLPVISVSETSSSDVIPINASQVAQSTDMTIPIIAVLFIVNGVLGYFIYKKHYAKKSIPATFQPSKLDYFRKLLKIPVETPRTQKPVETFEIIGDDEEEDETFEIIGDDDISEAEQELKKYDLQKIGLLKKIRKMQLDKLNDTGDRKVMAKVTQLDREIEDMERRL